jgi:adenosylcobinamide-GDP ribazoletransferase
MALAPLAALPLAVACALAVWVGDAVTAPPLLIAVAVVAVLALGSGGLHLDGLADTADGLAVPGDRDRRLQVMRSGDVGPVGAATLLLVVLAQVSSLAEVVARGDVAEAVTTTVLAVVVSRTAATVACARGVPSARPDGLGSAVAGSVPRLAALLVGVLLLGAVGLVAAATDADAAHAVAGIVVSAALVGALLLRARRRLGGVTGDVLGACIEVALAGYLVAQVVTLPV